MSKLSDKQLRFVHEYLIDQNASAAAVRAGYSEKTKGTQAVELMKNPLVKARILEELSGIYAQLKVTALDVLRAQVAAAYFDPACLFDAAREPVPLHTLGAQALSALTVSYDQRSNGEFVMRVRQTPRHVAVAALQRRQEQFEKLKLGFAHAQMLAQVEIERIAARPAQGRPVVLDLEACQARAAAGPALTAADWEWRVAQAAPREATREATQKAARGDAQGGQGAGLEVMQAQARAAALGALSGAPGVPGVDVADAPGVSMAGDAGPGAMLALGDEQAGALALDGAAQGGIDWDAIEREIDIEMEAHAGSDADGLAGEEELDAGVQAEAEGDGALGLAGADDEVEAEGEGDAAQAGAARGEVVVKAEGKVEGKAEAKAEAEAKVEANVQVDAAQTGVTQAPAQEEGGMPVVDTRAHDAQTSDTSITDAPPPDAPAAESPCAPSPAGARQAREQPQEPLQEQAQEQFREQAQEQALEQAQNQTQNQTQEQGQDQAQDQAQNQAQDQAQQQASDQPEDRSDVQARVMARVRKVAAALLARREAGPPQYATRAASMRHAASAAPVQHTTSAAPLQYAASTAPLQYAPSTTPLQYAPSTTPPQYAASTAPPQYAASTAPPQYAPSTTPPQYAPSTTPLQHTACAAPLQYAACAAKAAAAALKAGALRKLTGAPKPYNFREDPNWMWGGAYRRNPVPPQELPSAGQIAQAVAAARLRPRQVIRPGGTPPGFNPPPARDHRPQFALGAGEFHWS